MAVTEKEIDQFQQFARTKIADDGEELTWQELFNSWMLECPPTDERQQVNAIIRQGIADIDAGRTRPVEHVNDEMRKKYDLA